MSRRAEPQHLRQERILAALMYGKSVSPTRAGAIEAARGYLRGQRIRATEEEVQAVLGETVGDLLFPPCGCHFLEVGPGQQQLLAPGPHHEAGCPAWRAVQ